MKKYFGRNVMLSVVPILATLSILFIAPNLNPPSRYGRLPENNILNELNSVSSIENRTEKRDSGNNITSRLYAPY